MARKYIIELDTARVLTLKEALGTARDSEDHDYADLKSAYPEGDESHFLATDAEDRRDRIDDLLKAIGPQVGDIWEA